MLILLCANITPPSHPLYPLWPSRSITPGQPWILFPQRPDDRRHTSQIGFAHRRAGRQTQLGADRAACAGDEHALAPQHAAHRADVGAHRFAAPGSRSHEGSRSTRSVWITKITKREAFGSRRSRSAKHAKPERASFVVFALRDLRPISCLRDPNTSDDARLYARLVADAHDVANLHPPRGGHGDDHLPDLVLLDRVGERMAVAQHWYAVDLHVVLAQVVVQEADRLGVPVYYHVPVLRLAAEEIAGRLEEEIVQNA